MHWRPLLLPLTASLATLASAQAVPTATAATPSPATFFRSLPLIDGQFDYALNASEVVETGYGSNNGAYYSTNLSGDIVYTSKSTSRPFSAVYAGGILISNQSNQATEPFQSLSLSQGFIGRGWAFSFSDSVSYLPSSPTVGLSGIPGTGDLGSQPVFTGDGPAQNVLTTNSARVSNSATAGVSRQLTATTSLSGTASYGILRFLGGYGFDNSQIAGSLSLSHEFDARDTGSLSASYAVFSYPGSYSFTSRGLTAGFSRRLTRNLTAQASAGPLWINSSASLGIPSRLTVSTDTGITYNRNSTTVGVHVTRGVNGGSGVQPGAISTGFLASYQHRFGRGWSLGATQTYFFSDGLSNGNITPAADPILAQGQLTGSINSSYSGVQLSRRFTDNLSGFVSYTAQYQSFDTPALGNSSTALSGLSNVFGFGVSFSPRATRLGQF